MQVLLSRLPDGLLKLHRNAILGVEQPHIYCYCSSSSSSFSWIRLLLLLLLLLPLLLGKGKGLVGFVVVEIGRKDVLLCNLDVIQGVVSL
eukprot:evm.model.NODE_7561_length_7680_cov_7.999219.1